MRVAAALFVLLAATASAQDDLSYGPFRPAPRDHSFAVGVAPHGLLVAWSEIDPGSDFGTIHTGLFDFDGKLVSPVHTLLPSSAGSHATTPAVATDGERFFVAWLELDRSTWQPSRVAGAVVDRTGVQLSGTLDLGRAIEGSPMLTWDGLAFRVYGNSSYTVSPDGVVTKMNSQPVRRRVPFATPDAHGWVDWTSGRAFSCWMGPGCYGNPGRYTYTLDWAVVSHNWIRTGSYRDFDYLTGKPAVLPRGDDFLAIWTDGKTLFGLPVVDGISQRPFRMARNLPHDLSEPAAAESLVVYEMAGDIYGVVIHDGARFGEPFPITSDTRREELPRVYLVGPHRYLVTYVIERDPAGLRMGGRFVTVSP